MYWVHEEERAKRCVQKVIKDGGIAQLGEHLLCKQGVRSSNLLTSTKRSWKDSYKDRVNKRKKRKSKEKV